MARGGLEPEHGLASWILPSDSRSAAARAMRTELCITEADMGLMREQLLSGSTERCAVLYAAESRRRNGQTRLLVREVEFPDSTAYTSQSPFDAELSPGFVASVAKRAARDKLTLVVVHTCGASGAGFFPR